MHIPFSATRRMRRLLRATIAEARFDAGLRSNIVEALLLRILLDSNGGAATALRDKRDRLVDLLRAYIETANKEQKGGENDLDNVLREAKNAARRMHHGYLGTEHFLLGFLECYNGAAKQLLLNEGITLEDAESRIKRTLYGAEEHGRVVDSG